MKLKYLNRPVAALTLLFFISLCISCASQTSLPLLSRLANPPVNNKIILDGQFTDWQSVDLLATDPAGDASGSIDITQIQAVRQGNWLYLSFDVGQPQNLQKARQPNDGTLQIHLTHADKTFIIDTRQRTAYFKESPDQRIPWRDFDYVAAPTYACDRFELRLNLLPLFGPKAGSVQLNLTGSDTLAQPVTIAPATGDTTFITPGNQAQPAGDHTTIRLANLNTLRNGLVDPERQPALSRLLQFAQADIYCFQEEWHDKPLEPALQKILGRDVYVHKVKGCVVASPHPLTALPIQTPGRDLAAAGVQLPTGERVIVISVHLKCCGTIDSPEDQQRVDQIEALMNALKTFRDQGSGDEKADLFRQSPVLIIGDWNLVGSNKPLLTATSDKDLPLRWYVPLRADGETTYTWRSTTPGDTFAPGLLDALVYSPVSLKPIRAEVFDSTTNRSIYGELPGQSVVQPNDSEVSDHLMLIAEFGITQP